MGNEYDEIIQECLTKMDAVKAPPDAYRQALHDLIREAQMRIGATPGGVDEEHD